MYQHIVIPISILCGLSQLVSRSSAQWVDSSSRLASGGRPLDVPNSFGYGIGPGVIYGGRPVQQVNYGSGIPLNCMGPMSPGVSGIGYGNPGPGYVAPIGQPLGYGNGIESNCISNCLMGAGLDYGNGLGVVPSYPGGASMPGGFLANPVTGVVPSYPGGASMSGGFLANPGAGVVPSYPGGASMPGGFLANPNPGYPNAVPNLVGALDPSIGGFGNGLSINPTAVPPIPQQTSLNANENTNTNTNVNINNNMDKHRQGRFGLLGNRLV